MMALKTMMEMNEKQKACSNQHDILSLVLMHCFPLTELN